MLKINYEAQEDDITTTSDIVLLNEKNRPTPTLIGLAAAELAADALIAFGLYKVFKFFGKKK